MSEQGNVPEGKRDDEKDETVFQDELREIREANLEAQAAKAKAFGAARRPAR